MTHDHGVDFRPNHPDTQFNCGIGGKDVFMNQMKNFSHNDNMWTDCHFLRGERDPSHMHLELLEYDNNGSEFLAAQFNKMWFDFEFASRSAKKSWSQSNMVSKR